MELFDLEEKGQNNPSSPSAPPAPLADRMRPTDIKGFIGQEHVVGAGKFLERVIKGGELPSMIIWGPPGTGKTTLARIVAGATGARFMEFSAVLSGVKEIREVMKGAKEALARGKKTVLFVDEIHRFNKAQQDAFLHSVEDGTITLIGATTENPSFEVNAPLLSRCRVVVLEALSDENIKEIIEKALNDKKNGLGDMAAKVDEGVVGFIAENSQGDARAALNCLDAAFMITASDKDGIRRVTLETTKEAMQKKALIYDKGAEEHYNIISAFIKSMRATDPDAALYYLARMVEAGEDPIFIARRMVIFASEDVGNADPRALSVAMAVKDAVGFIGMPEGWIPLAQGVTYLASAPKSNASYTAYMEAASDVRKYGAIPVPLYLRNAPTDLMKKLGFGKGYKYPHNFKGAVTEQKCLPEKLAEKTYYNPSERGYEKTIRDLLKKKKP